MIIAFDLDGVLVQWGHPFARLLQAQGATVPDEHFWEEPAEWDWNTRLATYTQNEAAWDHIKTHPSWWAELPLHQDVAPEDILRLKRLTWDATVYFVTSRPKNARKDTERWLWERLGLLGTVVVVPKSERKASVLVDMRVDVIVEDRLQTLIEVQTLCVQRKQAVPKCILVDRPYNQESGAAFFHKRKRMCVVPTTGAAIRRLHERCVNAGSDHADSHQ